MSEPDTPMTPEERKAARRIRQAAYQRAYMARKTEEQKEEDKIKRRAYAKTDGARARKAASKRRYIKKLRECRPEKLREILQREAARRRVAYVASPDFSGSVLAASAPSKWRDILVQITALAPKSDRRDEIIAEAALLVFEGANITDAVKKARSAVSRQDQPYYKTKSLDDCYWL